MTDPLYDRIWETVGKKVGYGIDCDVLTDALFDILNEERKDGRLLRSLCEVTPKRDARPFSDLTKDFTPERKSRIKEQSREVASHIRQNESFQQWFSELEGFHLREERFWDACDSKDPKELLDWLRTAWYLGYKQGAKDTNIT